MSYIIREEDSQDFKSPSSKGMNTLYVWPGEWELPSLDPECLIVMCYLKYANIEHKIIYVTSCLTLYKNDYPRLEYNNDVYIGVEQILNCFKKQKNIDKSLNNNIHADMLALLNLFKQKFVPAFNSLCWLDEENTFKVIRSAYGKYLRFPFSLIKLKQMANKHERSIMCNFKTNYIQYDGIKQMLLNDAKECLNELSYKLNENTFMFENRPTLIDTYLFGYLSILNKAPFQGSILKSHSIACSNLASLVYRINKDLFPNEPTSKINKLNEDQNIISSLFKKILSYIPFLSPPSSSLTSTFEQKENWEKRKQQILAVSIAFTAMILYAFSIGFIKIDIIRHDLEYTQKN